MARQPIWRPGSSSGKDPIVELMSRVSLDVGAPIPPVALALSTGPTSGAEEEAAVSALAGVIFGLKKDLMKEKLSAEEFAGQAGRGGDAAPGGQAGQVQSDGSAGGVHKRTPAHPIQRLTLGAPGPTANSVADTKGRDATLATKTATGGGPKVIWRARRIGRTANGKRIWVSDSEASGSTSSESEGGSGSGTSDLSEGSESETESYSGDSYTSDSYSGSYSDSYSDSYSSGAL